MCCGLCLDATKNANLGAGVTYCAKYSTYRDRLIGKDEINAVLTLFNTVSGRTELLPQTDNWGLGVNHFTSDQDKQNNIFFHVLSIL
ncbi:hypothetical protein C2L64_32710 [Paraburkholderia hospita]|uniref:Uncharacterized protein n=1 Tax=Paraburkholderia hospita TaxID=169430 RepID=A0AAN1JGF6_9BURK|nr:hypothetical protein C2L64_32710 [Paraburkholderia hospita]